MSQIFGSNPGGGGGTGIQTIELDSGSISGSNVVLSGGTTGLTTEALSATEGELTGTLSVAHGGTGASTLTGILTGNGTSPITASPVNQYDTLVAGASNAVTGVAPSSTAGYVYASNGNAANPSFQSLASLGVFSWVSTTSTLINMQPNVGYVLTDNQAATLSFTTPLTIGAQYGVLATGTASFEITQSSGQRISIEELSSTTGILGGIASTKNGQGAVFVAVSTTELRAISAAGNIGFA